MVLTMVKKWSCRVRMVPHPYCWQDQGKSTGDPHMCLIFRGRANTVTK